MPVIAATNLHHAFGDRVILRGCTLAVEDGERVGIVGRNGAGKSTLIKAMGGLLTPDSGTVELQRGARLGYLHQDHDLDPDDTLREGAARAFAELSDLHAKLERVFDDMANADGGELERLLKEQERLENRIEAAGGYAVDHKIDAVLHGLGFTDAQFGVKCADLSGGQKARLSLGKLLLEGPDVLLLDEPTNHLDLDGRIWLEGFLKEEFKGAVVMISHDRYLLDHVVTRICEVEHGRTIEYPGNYAAFREIRADRRLSQLRAYEKQQTKWKSEEAFIRKYKAGQRAKQAQGRQSRLDREREQQALEKPMEMATLRLEIPKAERSGDLVVVARGLRKGYEGKPLFSNVDITISRGERWGVIGPNGAGKSTLVRCMLGEQDLDAGEVRPGSNLQTGYFRQSHEGLDPELIVYRYLQRVIQKERPDAPLSEQQARNLAGAFLFSGREQEKQLGDLSGGERARAVMAGLLASGKNLLVLDEPTNHLDIPSAERLEEVLALPVPETSESPGRPGGPFDGTLILISHDRALIDACCDHLIVLDGAGNVELFDGNYTDWQRAHDERARARAQQDAAERERELREEKKVRQQAHQQRERERKAKGPSVSGLSRLKTEQLEQKIEETESRIRAIDQQMGDPDVWSDPKKCAKLGDERARLVSELEPLEFEWMSRAEEA
ncbi:MAG: ABC-F family ATP-binding cassette domain-containing protein [Phycisphaerales bacterium]